MESGGIEDAPAMEPVPVARPSVNEASSEAAPKIRRAGSSPASPTKIRCVRHRKYESGCAYCEAAK